MNDNDSGRQKEHQVFLKSIKWVHSVQTESRKNLVNFRM